MPINPYLPKKPKPPVFPTTGGQVPQFSNPALPGPEITYRGGETGVGSDFGLRDRFAAGELDAYLDAQNAGYQSNLGLRNNFAGLAGQGYLSGALNQQQSALGSNQAIRSQAAGMATAAALGQSMGLLRGAIGEARSAAGSLPGMFADSRGRFSRLADIGFYDPAMMERLGANAYAQTAQTGRTLGANLNNSLASRGLSSNPLAGLALRQQAAFQGSADRGNILAGLERENAQGRLQGTQGLSQLAQQEAALRQAYESMILGGTGQLAAMGLTPTQESAMGLLQDVPGVDMDPLTNLYQQYANQQVQQPNFKGAGGIYDKYRGAPIGPGAGLQSPNEQAGIRPRPVGGRPGIMSGPPVLPKKKTTGKGYLG